MNKLTKLLLSASLLLSFYANADQDKKIYFLLEGGRSKISNVDKIVSMYGTSIGKKATSPVFSGGVGYQFNKNLRSDITINYLLNTKNKLNGVTIPAGFPLPGGLVATSGNVNIKGTVNSIAGMFNSYYALVGFHDSFTPFIGAGIGLARNNYKLSVSGNLDANLGVSYPVNVIQKKSATNLVYQLGFGALIKVNPNMDFKLAFRFNDFGKVKMENIETNTKVDGRIQAHQILAGLQFTL